MKIRATAITAFATGVLMAATLTLTDTEWSRALLSSVPNVVLQVLGAIGFFAVMTVFVVGFQHTWRNSLPGMQRLLLWFLGACTGVCLAHFINRASQ